MTLIGEMGERQLIEDFGTFIVREGEVGPGDDAAVLSRGVVVSTDAVTFDRHMPAGMTYEQFGWYSAAVSFSDLAAMGARPTGILAALALPGDLDVQAAYDIMSGISQCAEFCETGIAGGDTKVGPGVVTTTAIGSMDGRRPMLRSGARPGDVVALTGPVGGPAAGYISLELGVDADDARSSLYVPVPRIAEGAAMAASGAVTSCMDLSDGLGTALNTICQSSGVGMEVELSFIPRGPSVDEMAEASGRDVRDLLLGWGGEYELLFTASQDRLDALYEAEVPFSIIGIVNDTGAPHLTDGGKRTVIPYGKYREGRGLALRQGRRVVRLPSMPPRLQDRPGADGQVHGKEGGRRHARRVHIREGHVDERGPDGEEAAVPLPPGGALPVRGERRLQHALQALSELRHIVGADRS